MKLPTVRPVPQMDQAHFPHEVHEFLPVSAVDFKLDGDRHGAVIRMWRVNQFVRKAGDRGRIEIERSGEVDRESARQSQTNQEQNRRSKQRISRACRCDSATPDHPAKSQSSLYALSCLNVVITSSGSSRRV